MGMEGKRQGQSLAIQLAKSVRKHHFDEPRAGINPNANVLRQGYEQLALGRVHHEDGRAGAALARELHIHHHSRGSARLFAYFATDEIVDVVVA